MKRRIRYLKQQTRRTAVLCLCLCAAFLLAGCTSKDDPNTVVILNYGKYFDPKMIDLFTEETGIQVKYEEYESPEEMYAKYKAGSIHYDLACTSDYIIQKLIQEGETLEINFDNIPEITNIDQKYIRYCKNFDSDNRFTLPYFFGTVGILYNTKMVDAAETDTWNVLWDEKYAGQIIMENSVRDTYMVAQKLLGASCNTTDQKILDQSLDLLLKQKPLIHAYLTWPWQTLTMYIMRLQTKLSSNSWTKTCKMTKLFFQIQKPWTTVNFSVPWMILPRIIIPNCGWL